MRSGTVALPNLDSIVRGLLYVYIFSLSFRRLLVIERNSFIILIALFVLWCAVNRKHFFLRTPIDFPLIAFIGWVGLSVPFAAFPSYSFQEFAKLLQQGLVFYAVVYFFHDPVHKRRLAWMLIGTLGLVGMYGLWEYASVETGNRKNYFVESFLHGDAALATYLVMLAPLSAAAVLYFGGGWRKLLAAGAVGFALLCQVLTFSKGGILAMMTETIAFAWITRQRKVVYWATVAGIILIVGMGGFFIASRVVHSTSVFVPGQGKFNARNVVARFNVWTFGVEKMTDHPLVGIGYGKNTFYLATGNEGERLSTANGVIMPAGTHNTFLDIAVGAGIPALLAFIWLLWTILRAGRRQLRCEPDSLAKALALASVVAVMGMSMRNFFDHMWVGTLAVQFWVLVGLCMRPLADNHAQVQSIGPGESPGPAAKGCEVPHA